MRKIREMVRGGSRRWRKAVFSALLAAIFSISLISLSEAQVSRAKRTTAPAAEGGSQVQKAASPASPGKQKVSGTGKQAVQKTQPASAPASAGQPKPTSASIKGIPEATLQVLKENRFLEEELKLAKTPQYYFVLNLKQKTLELRARGMVLKSWKASELRYTGKPVPLQVTTLTNKTALNPPERKVLNPAEQQAEEARKAAGEKARLEQEKKKETEKKREPAQATATPADTFDVEALEITDMPGSYELNFDDGLRIFIRSKSGFSEKFRQTRETVLWYTWYPVKHFLHRKSELRPQLILYFDNMRDAQGIYWAFIDGLKGIIWFP